MAMQSRVCLAEAGSYRYRDWAGRRLSDPSRMVSHLPKAPRRAIRVPLPLTFFE